LLPSGSSRSKPPGWAGGSKIPRPGTWAQTTPTTKTTGLIFFPGTMVGMLLAGADPTDAVRLQLILLYVLLGSVAIAALLATTLSYRSFFTPAHQLRELRMRDLAQRMDPGLGHGSARGTQVHRRRSI